MKINSDVDFRAAVNAGLFLKLISSLTSEQVEFKVTNNFLEIHGDGKYRLPLIYDGEDILSLPEITIDNVTANFNISKNILNNILNYNMKELNKGVVVRPVQKLLYLDQNGCITFTSGACVNNFNLGQNIKLLLTPKIVKLFKLFKDEEIEFKLGHDVVNGLTLTKVLFSDSFTTISSIVPSDDAMLNSIPVQAIRGRAMSTYSYSVNLNKDLILNTIKRLTLFASKQSDFVLNINFKEDCLDIRDDYGNYETIKYDSNNLTGCSYIAKLDSNDLKLTLEACQDRYITCSFGNHQAIVISKNNIYNVIPEVI